MDYKEANLRNSLDNKIQESLESQQSHWTSRIEILFNISTGMRRIHRTGCIHRNLHCGNILVKIKANRIHTYVAGFGFSSDVRTNKAVALKVHFEPFGDIQIESSYTLHKGACYTRRTFDFSQFSEPKNRKDHYIYPQL
ncbi:1273_t:CDS:2 [Entrophospora sp. SA101]|nr:1273_t:CDS:2 [Entrophospora sp. SA101]